MPQAIDPHRRAQIRVWDSSVVGNTPQQIAADEQVARPMISRIISRWPDASGPASAPLGAGISAALICAGGARTLPGTLFA
jgi:hypothetical protein